MYLLLYIHTIRLCCLSEGCIRDHDFKKGVLVFCTVGVKVANEVVYINNNKYTCLNDVENIYL